MKKLKFNKELCVGCHKCEDVCSNAFFKEKDREKSSIKINEGEKVKYNAAICNQCGECIDVCPVEAIYRDKNGVVRIKKDICVGCFMCVGACPQGAMMYHVDLIEPFKCIACGLCAKECPTGALSIEEE